MINKAIIFATVAHEKQKSYVMEKIDLIYSSMLRRLSNLVVIKYSAYRYDPDKILLYSVAELSIICCGKDDCLDLCGFAFSKLTGSVTPLSTFTRSEIHCHRIVESIRKNDANYEAIAELVQYDSKISKCGRLFKDHIKQSNESKEDVEDLLIFLRYYRETYLPAIYELMKSGIESLNVEVRNPKARECLENTIKAKKRAAKSLIDKIEAYFEVKAIL